MSYATALRRLQERVKEGRLTHPGYLSSPFYFPVLGHFGISREKHKKALKVIESEDKVNGVKV